LSHLGKSGQATTRREAAVHLAVHRNTIALWLRTYRDRGLSALLTYKEPGAPSGQKSLPAAVFAPLQARWATSSGFAQTPPDLVVKLQPTDIADVISWLVVAPCAMSQREIKG
jgi:hypothetical protein